MLFSFWSLSDEKGVLKSLPVSVAQFFLLDVFDGVLSNIQVEIFASPLDFEMGPPKTARSIGPMIVHLFLFSGF